MRRSLQSRLGRAVHFRTREHAVRSGAAVLATGLGCCALAGWVSVGVVSGGACKWRGGRTVQKLYAVSCASVGCLSFRKSLRLCTSRQ